MKMHTLAPLAVALAWVAVAPLAATQGQAQGQAQGQTQGQTTTKPDPKPEAKPEAKTDPKSATAANLAGKWAATVTAANGPIESAIDMKADPKDAKKVAGTISSPMGQATFEGEVVEGKLTFWFTMNANGTDLSVTFVGTLQKDGSLAGTLIYGQGEATWSAVREKK